MKGQIIRVISGFFDIKSHDKVYRTRGSGVLRKNKISPKVGDFVEFNIEGNITKVYERNNFLVRPPVANIDLIVVVQSLVSPEFRSLFLNKILTAFNNKEIEIILVFTKKDLFKNYKTIIRDFQKDGYQTFVTSIYKKWTFWPLKKALKNKLVVFTGVSGSGKSSLINLITGSSQITQSISKKTQQGKQTTRVVEIVESKSYKFIDTPGFSSFDLELSKKELAKAFYNMSHFAQTCKFFRNCLHYKEKHCAIKQALIKGNISQKRYQDYLKLLKEAK